MGCATDPGRFKGAPLREPLTRSLPPPPAYLEPVLDPTRTPKSGDSAIYVAKVRGTVIKSQNRIIGDARKWYDGVRKTYSTTPTPKNRFYGF